MVLRSCVLLYVLAFAMQGDVREVIKITIGRHETVYTQYIQGKDSRSENRSSVGGASVSIWNFEKRSRSILDPEAKEYVELGASPDFVLTLARWIARPPRVHDSGRTVNVFYETVDTGETRAIFGRVARHFLTRERRVAEPGACSASIETDTDGWYIDYSEVRSARHFADMHLEGGIACRDIVVRHGNPLRPGFPVLEKEATPGGPEFIAREVMDLSFDPLDKSLFEIPEGFKKVDSLHGQPSMNWSARLEMELTQLEPAVGSWLE